METRRCALCGEHKPVNQFNCKLRHADRTLYDCYCRPCRRVYRQQHYQDNKVEYYRRLKERQRRLIAMVEEMKARPCADCGVQYSPWQMDFDHVTGKKVMGVANMLRQYGSRRRLLAEIAKCEVVCANCHRNRTHFRRLAALRDRRCEGGSREERV